LGLDKRVWVSVPGLGVDGGVYFSPYVDYFGYIMVTDLNPTSILPGSGQTVWGVVGGGGVRTHFNKNNKN
jgi:hypothetical protein